jgi:hypothetical protein
MTGPIPSQQHLLRDENMSNKSYEPEDLPPKRREEKKRKNN